jgi:hypothetical protein
MPSCSSWPVLAASVSAGELDDAVDDVLEASALPGE